MESLMSAGGGCSGKFIIANAKVYGAGVGAFTYNLRYMENGNLIEEKSVQLMYQTPYDFHGIRITYSDGATGIFTALVKCKKLTTDVAINIDVGKEISRGLYTQYSSFVVSL